MLMTFKHIEVKLQDYVNSTLLKLIQVMKTPFTQKTLPRVLLCGDTSERGMFTRQAAPEYLQSPLFFPWLQVLITGLYISVGFPPEINSK